LDEEVNVIEFTFVVGIVVAKVYVRTPQ